MKKYIFFFLLAFAYSYQVPAHANPYVADHASFVTASEQQKERYIISVMKFMVDLDEQYKKDVKTSGYSEERFQNFKRTVQRLSDFLISNAHAQAVADPDFKFFAEQFKTSLSQQEGKKDPMGCIYSGWVSKKVGNYCKHPLSPSIAANDPIRLAYSRALKNATDSKTTGCAGEGKMICNPVVFGYDKINDKGTKSPLCVSNSGNEHNVSWDCMRKSLGKDTEDLNPEKDGLKIEAKQNAAKARMEYLKGLMSAPENAQSFKEVHDNIFNVCVCSHIPGQQGVIYTKYRDYAKTHRTCFGWMNNIREIHSACEFKVPEGLDTLKDFYKEWSDAQFDPSKAATYDYGKLKNEYNESDKRLNEYFKGHFGNERYTAYCSALNSEPTCKTNCEAVGKNKVKCTITELFKGEKDFLPLLQKEKIPTVKEFLRPITDKTWIVKGASCPIQDIPVVEEKKDICKIECEEKKEGDKTKYSCKVVEFEKKDGTNLEKLKELKKDIIESDTEPKNPTEVEGLQCPVSFPARKFNSCEITLTPDEKGESVKASIKFLPEIKDDKRVANWAETGFTSDAKTPNEAVLAKWEGTPIDFIMKLKAPGKDGKPEEFDCPGKLAAKDDASEKRACKIVDNGSADKVVKAKVTIENKIEGDEITTVTWSKKNVEEDDKDNSTASFNLNTEDEESDDYNSLKISATVVVTGKDSKTETLPPCEVELPASEKSTDSKDKLPTIKIKGGKPSEGSKSVFIDWIEIPDEENPPKTKKVSEVPARWSVIWIREGASDLTFTKKKAAEKVDDGMDNEVKNQDNVTTTTNVEEDSTETDPEKPKAKMPEGDIPDDGGKVNNPRKSHNYGVCAYLVKEADPSIKVKSNCVKIPGIPNDYTRPTGKPFQRMLRQVFDTWTTGKQ